MCLDGSPTAPGLLAEILPASAALSSDPICPACRPVDTADGLLVLRGPPVDDAAIGPTPGHEEERAVARRIGKAYLRKIYVTLFAVLSYRRRTG